MTTNRAFIQQAIKEANRTVKQTDAIINQIKKLNTKRMKELGKYHSQMYDSFRKTSDMQQKRRIHQVMKIVRTDYNQLKQQNNTLAKQLRIQ